MNTKDQILNDFNVKKGTLDNFGDRLLRLFQDLLGLNQIEIHQINCRIKHHSSLSKKIDKKNGKYTCLDDITDLVGIRIISYLESDVDLIYDLVKEEFEIDTANSIDKRDLGIAEFGYKSLHLVVSLNKERTNLKEYKEYKNIKCEIQIRSILQHAWAEIEHDLGYKSKSSIPEQYKRNFNRLAALLETADIEFDRLKKELTQYEVKVGDLIKTQPQNVEIDQTSLSKFDVENAVLKGGRELVVKLKGVNFESYDSQYTGIVERFKLFNMTSIKDIETSLSEDRVVFYRFVEEFVKEHSYTVYPISIVLFYYQHFLAAKSQDVAKMLEYAEYGNIKLNINISTAKKIIKMYGSSLKDNK